MKLEEQVCSLELAKRLKELGVEQESLFAWARVGRDFELVITDEIDVMDREPPITVHEGTKDEGWHVQECYAAFTVAELGELLPRCYMSWATPQNGEMKWWCHRMEHHFVTHEETPTFTAETEADARAKMLVHLSEREGKE